MLCLLCLLVSVLDRGGHIALPERDKLRAMPAVIFPLSVEYTYSVLIFCLFCLQGSLGTLHTLVNCFVDQAQIEFNVKDILKAMLIRYGALASGSSP